MKNLTNIQECAKLYGTLFNKFYIYKIEGDITFKISFSAGNFYHLLGLHKLTDLPQLIIDKKINTATKIYSKILDGDISCKTIESSAHYSKIADRITYFEKILEVLDSKKCKIIIDFDATKIKDCKLTETKYILYVQLADKTYFLLTLGEARENKIYPETVMFEPSSKYNSEQNLLDVYDIKVKIRKPKGKQNKNR